MGGGGLSGGCDPIIEAIECSAACLSVNVWLLPGLMTFASLGHAG